MSGSGGYKKFERGGLRRCALDSCGWCSDSEVGFASSVKKIYVVQRRDKTFSYFRMTEKCQDFSGHQVRAY